VARNTAKRRDEAGVRLRADREVAKEQKVREHLAGHNPLEAPKAEAVPDRSVRAVLAWRVASAPVPTGCGSAELRELSSRLRSPVVALASQNRAEGDYDGRKGSASLSSLKESGDLEYGADVVLFLTPAKERHAVAPARAVDLTIGKNRNGDTGRVELIFRPDIATLREVATT